MPPELLAALHLLPDYREQETIPGGSAAEHHLNRLSASASFFGEAKSLATKDSILAIRISGIIYREIEIADVVELVDTQDLKF